MSTPPPGDKAKKVTFRAKEASTCPICTETHNREQMLQGGGRLIAGSMTKELRRNYEKNKKFGRVNPLDYAVAVCPRCLYAAFPKDFNSLAAPEIDAIKHKIEHRKNYITKIFGPLDMSEDRNLASGAASHLLAVECYQLRGPLVAPSPKKGISSIRAAWYFNDLEEEFPGQGFQKVADLLYQKTALYYSQTLEFMQNGAEPVEQAAGILGPDLDNNWGWDGVVFLNAYLTMRFRDQIAPSPKEQLKLLAKSKVPLAKLYGMGKGSKGKPTPILEMSKELYEEYQSVIESLGGDVS